MLFSEPKISQSPDPRRIDHLHDGFSALQRAENFSIDGAQRVRDVKRRFQCSSASRKFLNLCAQRREVSRHARFSALQRAENFSIHIIPRQPRVVNRRFSALQRAENFSIGCCDVRLPPSTGFSALQRAENFSIGQQALDHR